MNPFAHERLDPLAFRRDLENVPVLELLGAFLEACEARVAVHCHGDAQKNRKNEEEKRTNYMVQLNRATNAFVYTFEKSPFQ